MVSFERFNDLLHRLGSYAWWEIAVEIVVIWLVVFAVFRFVQGTRAARAIKGLIVLLIFGAIFMQLLGDEHLERLGYLYNRMLAVIAIAMVVIFQPELRRALIRLGETKFMRSGYEGAARVAGEVAPACRYLSKARFGAIVVIERRVGLKGIAEVGTILDAHLTAPLLQTIFYPGSALHDLAVVIRGDKVYSAGVQLPMAGPTDLPDRTLGSRHRAAVGVTKDSDALVVVVSEETGLIRVAQRGVLSGAIDPEALESVLASLLGHDGDSEDSIKPEASGSTAVDEGFADDVGSDEQAPAREAGEGA
ncbi:MAG: diadenylate cyclase CdaA [Phycisphaerales bacterium]|nr:diadenylate cyclase CdaA [Phycisphaerales bacterium]